MALSGKTYEYKLIDDLDRSFVANSCSLILSYQVLWNPQCLDEVLRLAAEFGADAGAPASSRGLWNQRVREWIAYAIVLAPCTVQGLLQVLLRRKNSCLSKMYFIP